MPVLDGTSEAEDLGFDLSRFPGWSAEQVQKYLDSVGLKTNLQSGISNKLRKIPRKIDKGVLESVTDSHGLP